MPTAWFLTALLAAALIACAAKPPKVQWTKAFAGWGSSDGACVQQVSDGYIVVGNTDSDDSTPDAAILLAKVNSDGTKAWQKIIKTGVPIDANSVLQTADGGYVVAGTEPPDSVSLFKTDAQGNLLWLHTVAPGVYGQGYSVVHLANQGFVVAAQRIVSDSGLLLCWTDSLGDSLAGFPRWKLYPVAYPYHEPVSVSLRQASDGGFIVGTQTLLRVNSQGTQQWLKTFANLAEASCAIPTSDGGYAAVGPTRGGIGLLKTNANGDTAGGAGWLKTYAPSEYSLGNWVEQTADGGYIVAGAVQPGKNVWSKAILLRMSSDGTPSWMDTLCIGGAECVRQTWDGGYIATGSRFDPSAGSQGVNYMFLTKLTPEGKR